MEFIDRLIRRWSDWIGDRSIELAIKAELKRQGFGVRDSKIRSFRLVAIQRPGWIQVSRFFVETQAADGDGIHLYGLVRDDGRRQRPAVWLSTDQRATQRQLDEWSEGLIRRD